MSMIRWPSLSEFVPLRQAIDRLFEDNFVSPSRLLGSEGAPLIEMYQTDKDVVVKVSLPGVRPEDTDITVTGDTLTIKGEAKSEKDVKEKGYIYQERRYGTLAAPLPFPAGLRPVKRRQASRTVFSP